MTSVQQSVLLSEFNETRARTLQLVKTLEKDDFIVQTAPFMSPPKWHLGHVSWLFEMLLDKKIENHEFYSKEYLKYLNSYYNKFGEQHDKDKRGIVSRPTVDEIFEYYELISKNVNEFLSKPVDEETADLFTMGIHHECQHQELLVYDLQHLLADTYRPVQKNELTRPSTVEQKSVLIKGGLYSMGYSGNNWCYDIELPEHKVYLNDSIRFA